MRVGFAGLSHLGIVSSIATASQGFEVIGFDPRSPLIQEIQKRQLPVLEPGLDDAFALCFSKMSFSDDVHSLQNADVVYISLDVETDSNNVGNLEPLRALIHKVDQALNPKTVLVVLSQLPPGFIKTLSLTDRPFYYQVETLIFGNAYERALKPERFIVGCATPEDSLHPHFEMVLKSFSCPILKMKFESAEISKIAINLYLASQVTLTNTLAEICSATGAVWNEVAGALKLDRRIGPYSYLQPGLGISGGNIERDLSIISRVADQVGSNSTYIKTSAELSSYHKDWVLRTLAKEVLQKKPKPKIGILGLAYKINTKSVKNSPSLRLLESLKEYDVQVYDPEVKWEPISSSFQVMSSAYDAANDVDVLVMMTPWKDFYNLQLDQIKNKMKGSVLIDPFHIFDLKKSKKLHLQHFVLGVPLMGEK